MFAVSDLDNVYCILDNWCICINISDVTPMLLC